MTARDVLVEHIEAFNARDVDRLMAGFTDDAEWVTGRDVVRGRAALTGFFAGAMSELLPTLELLDIVAAGDRAAAELHETWHHDGETRRAHIAGFYRLQGNRIRRAKIFREGSADPARE